MRRAPRNVTPINGHSFARNVPLLYQYYVYDCINSFLLLLLSFSPSPLFTSLFVVRMVRALPQLSLSRVSAKNLVPLALIAHLPHFNTFSPLSSSVNSGVSNSLAFILQAVLLLSLLVKLLALLWHSPHFSLSHLMCNDVIILTCIARYYSKYIINKNPFIRNGITVQPPEIGVIIIIVI